MCVCLFGRDWDTVAPPGIFFLKKCLIHLGSGWDTSTSKWQNWGAWRTADVARGSGAAQARGRGFGCCFFFFFLTSNAVLECGGAERLLEVLFFFVEKR